MPHFNDLLDDPIREPSKVVIKPRKQPASLGTVLPTVASLKADESWRTSLDKAKAVYARQCLKYGAPRLVNGEIRYYQSPKTYVVISDKFTQKWFEVRSDGDYAIEPRS